MRLVFSMKKKLKLGLYENISQKGINLVKSETLQSVKVPFFPSLKTCFFF